MINYNTNKPVIRRRLFRLKINFRAILRHLVVVVILFILIYIALPMSFFYVVDSELGSRIYEDVNQIPQTRMGIVFGAGLNATAKEPSAVLEDRIITAAEAYKKNKIQKLIMSGDNRYKDYNEPQVMIETARDNGIPNLDMQPDYAGRRTYDTCYRAIQIFGVEKAILITQRFHLLRSLYICSSLGMDVYGLTSDRRLYQNESLFTIRDYGALMLSYWELYVQQPEVVLGEKIRI